jgi:hypothetical protein
MEDALLHKPVVENMADGGSCWLARIVQPQRAVRAEHDSSGNTTSAEQGPSGNATGTTSTCIYDHMSDSSSI